MATVARVARRPLERADLERMGLPEEFWRVRLDGSPAAAAALVANYVARLVPLFERGVGLILRGPRGAGKTALASIIAREARVIGFPVYFTTVWDLRDAVRARTPFDLEQSVLDRARSVDLLVLDGLRTEDGPETFFGRRAIEELLASRASRERPTVVTTSLQHRELDDPAGPWRPLVQTGRLVTIAVDGPDLRAAQHEALKRALLNPSKPNPGAPR